MLAMKVTVSFGDTKLVVPCGGGELTIRELIEKATSRFKAASAASPYYNFPPFTVTCVTLARDGGILDWSDRVIDVVDDREMLIAQTKPPLPDNASNAASLHLSTAQPDMQSRASSSSPWDNQQSSHDVIVTPRDITETHAPRTPLLVRNNDRARSSTPLADARRSPADEMILRRTDRLSAADSDDMPPDCPISVYSTEEHTPVYNITVQLDAAVSGQRLPSGLMTKPFLDNSQRSAGLEIQNVSANSAIARDGRLRPGDRILTINGNSLLGVSFQQAQEVLREALKAPHLSLNVQTQSGKAPPPPLLPKPSAVTRHHATTNLSDIARVHTQSIIEQPNSNPAPPPPPRHSAPAGEDEAQPEAGVVTDSVSEQGLNSQNVRTLGHVFAIDLKKSADGLGFSVTARDNAPGPDNPIFIKSILNKGSAIRDGRLKAGDRLLEVDGFKLTGKTQSEAVSLLRAIPAGATVKMLLSRHGTPPPESSPQNLKTTAFPRPLPTLQDSENVQASRGTSASNAVASATAAAFDFERHVLTFEIPLNDTASAGLGVSVKGRSKDESDSGVFVKNVISGGAAHKDGRLRENDQLLSVNAVSLEGMDNTGAMSALRRAIRDSSDSGCVQLTVARRIRTCDAQSMHTTHSIGSSGSVTVSADVHQSPAIFHIPSATAHPITDVIRDARNQPKLAGLNMNYLSDNDAHCATSPDHNQFGGSASTAIARGVPAPPVPLRSFNLLPNKPSHPAAHRILGRGGNSNSQNRKSTSVDNLLNSRINTYDDEFGPSPFVRDGVGRRSMSEKKTNVFVDAKQYSFYKDLQMKKSLSDLTGEGHEGWDYRDCSTMPSAFRRKLSAPHESIARASAASHTPVIRRARVAHAATNMKRAASSDSLMLHRPSDLHSPCSAESGDSAIAQYENAAVISRNGHGRNSFRQAVDRSLQDDHFDDNQQHQQKQNKQQQQFALRPDTNGQAATPSSSKKKFLKGLFRLGKPRSKAQLGNSPRPLAIRLDDSVAPSNSGLGNSDIRGSSSWRQQQQQQGPPIVRQPLVATGRMQQQQHYQVGDDLYATVIKNRKMQQFTHR